MRPSRLARAVVLVCLFSLATLAQQATVRRGTNLRGDPSADNPSIGHLSKGDIVQLVDSADTNGYYHVQTIDGSDGWVWGHNLKIEPIAPLQPNPNANSAPTPNPSPSPTPNPSPNPTDTSPATAISSDWEKPVPTSNTLQGDEGSCGETGDGGDSGTNLRKNRVDLPSTYHLVTWDAINALQYPSGAPHSRANWSADQLAAIAPYEGTAVTAVGYLYNVRVESGGKGESTNCHFTQPADVDWHMYFDSDASKGEAEAIIAETTPRIRQQHPNWTTAKLASWKGTGVPVRLSGWLMLDPEHPDALGKSRGTLWEIHPVTKIEVQQNGNWVDLGSLP
jgi:hypothetical protein